MVRRREPLSIRQALNRTAGFLPSCSSDVGKVDVGSSRSVMVSLRRLARRRWSREKAVGFANTTRRLHLSHFRIFAGVGALETVKSSPRRCNALILLRYVERHSFENSKKYRLCFQDCRLLRKMPGTKSGAHTDRMGARRQMPGAQRRTFQDVEGANCLGR